MEINLCYGCMKELEKGEMICPHCGYEQESLPKEPYYLLPGTILHGRYLVGKALGSGGFGITYIGMDLVLNQKVAIKEYLPSDFATRMPGALTVSVFSGESAQQFAMGLEKFLDEARRLAELDSIPGVVKIKEFFADNQTAYIVMEFLEGQTLKSILQEKGKLSYNEAAMIILPVLNTLEEVHTATWDEEKKSCIIHRDVSPDNIFVTTDGIVKLLDFGAARYASIYHSKSLSVILKPGYAPEEQYRSRGNQGPWSDVYGAATTFYKMLTGITPEDAMERLSYDEVKDPRKLGVKMTENQENALMNALNVKAEDRTQTAGAFAEELLSVSPVLRKVIRTRRQDEGKLPKWVKAVLASAACLVLVFVGLIAFGVLDPNPSHWGNDLPEGMMYVPSLINREVEEAQAELDKEEVNTLTLSVEGKNYSTTIVENTIMSQEPFGGRIISAGGVVNVWVSAGIEKIYVPDIQYYTIEEAVAILEDLGFVVKQVREETTEFADGTVLSQSLTPDEEYDKGSVIELVIATGISIGTDDVEVPDLIGKTFEEAKDILAEAGLFIIKGESSYSAQYPQDVVLTQSVNQGEKVKQGSTITVSLNEAQIIRMPDVQYKEQAEAVATLEALGLKVTCVMEKSRNVKKGLVITQSVAAKTEMKEGDKVTLTISIGNETIVPDIASLSQSAARSKLESNGFKVQVVEQFSSTVSKGNAIATNPEAGSSAPEQSVVTLYISKGEDPSTTTVQVPRVIGSSRDEARAALQRLELTVSFREEYNENYAVGVVCAQTKEGASVKRGTEIIVTVSLGSQYVNVPSVLGKNASEAASQLKNLGFTVQYTSDSYSEKYAAGLICAQDKSGSQKRGSTVVLTISKGSEYVKLPSLIGLTPSAAQAQVAALGLSYKNGGEEWNENGVTAGLISSQSVSGSVKIGSVVTVMISKGSQYRTAPNVVGLSESAAISQLSQNDLGSNVTYAYNETVARGYVISQSASGRQAVGTTISIVVSRGTEGRWVKNSELGNYPTSDYTYKETKTEYVYAVTSRETKESGNTSESGWTRTSSKVISTSTSSWQVSSIKSEDYVSGTTRVQVVPESKSVTYKKAVVCQCGAWVSNADTWKVGDACTHGGKYNHKFTTLVESYGGTISGSGVSGGYIILVNGSKVSSYSFPYGSGFEMWSSTKKTIYRATTTKTTYYYERWVSAADVTSTTPLSNTSTKQYTEKSRTDYTYVVGK